MKVELLSGSVDVMAARNGQVYMSFTKLYAFDGKSGTVAMTIEQCEKFAEVAKSQAEISRRQIEMLNVQSDCGGNH